MGSVRPGPWDGHPAVRTGRDLSAGERAADMMKRAFSTWTAIGVIAGIMAGWIATGGLGFDREPFILLNLCLSCLAALQCFILLIAAKRTDQIAGELAQYDHEVGLRDLAVDEHNRQLLLAIAAKLGVERGEPDGEPGPAAGLDAPTAGAGLG